MILNNIINSHLYKIIYFLNVYIEIHYHIIVKSFSVSLSGQIVLSVDKTNLYSATEFSCHFCPVTHIPLNKWIYFDHHIPKILLLSKQLSLAHEGLLINTPSGGKYFWTASFWFPGINTVLFLYIKITIHLSVPPSIQTIYHKKVPNCLCNYLY